MLDSCVVTDKASMASKHHKLHVSMFIASLTMLSSSSKLHGKVVVMVMVVVVMGVVECHASNIASSQADNMHRSCHTLRYWDNNMLCSGIAGMLVVWVCQKPYHRR